MQAVETKVVSSRSKNKNTLSDTDARHEEAFKRWYLPVIGSDIQRFPCSGSESAQLSTWESARCVYRAQS